MRRLGIVFFSSPNTCCVILSTIEAGCFIASLQTSASIVSAFEALLNTLFSFPYILIELITVTCQVVSREFPIFSVTVLSETMHSSLVNGRSIQRGLVTLSKIIWRPNISKKVGVYWALPARAPPTSTLESRNQHFGIFIYYLQLNRRRLHSC